MPEHDPLPAWSHALLWPFSAEPNHPQLAGDLAEEYGQRLSADGPPAARRWLRREIWRTLGALLWRRETGYVLVAAAGSVILIGIVSQLIVRAFGPVLWVRGGAVLLSGQGERLQAFLVLAFAAPLIGGFASGIAAARLLSGHERLTRLAFAVFELGAGLIVTLIVATHGLAVWPMMLASAVSAPRLGAVAAMWTGSLLMERRRQPRGRPQLPAGGTERRV